MTTPSPSPSTSLRVAVTGASGLIGEALAESLSADGHRVHPLVREGGSHPEASNLGEEIPWDPSATELDPAGFEGIDAVVHLAGESIAERWSRAKKARILDSRVRGTRAVAEAVAKAGVPVLVCASAVGFYGDGGDEVLDESSDKGEGFLADVVWRWEAAAAAAREAGARVAHLRFGVVLSGKGGALAKMLPPFRLGAGGRLGDGRQWMSWIHLDDVVGAIRHVLDEAELEGPVNATAPNPVRNADFTKALGSALGRPTAIPVPAFALRLAFGEMAEETLLVSQRAVPERLVASGYSFRFPEVRDALEHEVG